MVTIITEAGGAAALGIGDTIQVIIQN